jgi:hypothetical protein
MPQERPPRQNAARSTQIKLFFSQTCVASRFACKENLRAVKKAGVFCHENVPFLPGHPRRGPDESPVVKEAGANISDSLHTMAVLSAAGLPCHRVLPRKTLKNSSI